MTRPHLVVLLVGNYVYDRQESMQRFVNILAAELPNYGITVEVYAPRAFFGRIKPSPTGFGKWLGYLDRFALFPVLLKRRAAQISEQCRKERTAFVIHICDHSNAMYTHLINRLPNLVTCHDLLAIRSAKGEIARNATSWSGQILQGMIFRGLIAARAITCVSQATRSDLFRLSHLPPEQVSVTYMGQNHPYRPMPLHAARKIVMRRFLRRDDEGIVEGEPFYILHVGGNHWYKNRLGVLEIYAALRRKLSGSGTIRIPRLVMVGPAPTDEMNQWLARHPAIQTDVMFLKGVDNDELGALYSAAELLLFPSIEEGFGWPVIEAQACGCRVVTTGKAPMTEVGGEAAAYLEPSSIDGVTSHGFAEAAKLVARILYEDEPTRKERIAAGMANAEKFSTEGMIRQYVRIYRELTSERAVDAPVALRRSVPSVSR